MDRRTFLGTTAAVLAWAGLPIPGKKLGTAKEPDIEALRKALEEGNEGAAREAIGCSCDGEGCPACEGGTAPSEQPLRIVDISDKIKPYLTAAALKVAETPMTGIIGRLESDGSLYILDYEKDREEEQSVMEHLRRRHRENPDPDRPKEASPYWGVDNKFLPDNYRTCVFMSQLVYLSDGKIKDEYFRKFAKVYSHCADQKLIGYGQLAPFISMRLIDDLKGHQRALILGYPFSDYSWRDLNKKLGFDFFIEEGGLGFDEWPDQIPV